MGTALISGDHVNLPIAFRDRCTDICSKDQSTGHIQYLKCPVRSPHYYNMRACHIIWTRTLKAKLDPMVLSAWTPASCGRPFRLERQCVGLPAQSLVLLMMYLLSPKSGVTRTHLTAASEHGPYHRQASDYRQPLLTTTDHRQRPPSGRVG
jgi:hypothetical protein